MRRPSAMWSRLLRRLTSRLYATRDAAVRRAMGARAERLVHVVLELRGGGAAGAPLLPPGAALRFASDDELDRAPLRHAGTIGNVEQARAAGDRCLVVEIDGDVVARAWLVLDQRRVARMLGSAHPPPLLPAAIVYEVSVRPEYRGRGLNGAMLARAAEEARAAGCTHLVAWIAAWNRSSLRSFAKAGFRPLAQP